MVRRASSTRRGGLLAVALGVLALLSAPAVAAGGGPADEEFVVVKAGKVITGSGEEIDRGEIVIVDGQIRLVGRRLEYPKTATVIHAETQTVMPGMVHCRTRAGLPSYQRSGVHGDLKTADEIYLDEMDLESFLRAGYTAVNIYPAGTGITGVSSVYRTAGPAGQRAVTPGGYLRTTMISLPRDKQTLRDALKKAKAEIDKVEKARQDWEAKRKEAEAKKAAEGAKPPEQQPPSPSPAPPTPPTPGPQPSPTPPKSGPQLPAADKPAPQETAKPAGDASGDQFKPPETDPSHRALMDLIQKKDGAPALMLEVPSASNILHALEVLQGFDQVTRTLWLGGGFAPDFNNAVAKLGELKSLVITAPAMHRLPATINRYNLVAELFGAGCEVALAPENDSPQDLEAVRARTADLVRSGLQRSDAVKALTVNAAKAAGVGKQLGSIEKGKDADLVFLDGDVLDPGARVQRVMILGKVVWKAKD